MKMIKVKTFTSIISITILTAFFNVAKAEKITSSHVYQQTENIILEIRLIRQAMKITDYAVNPGLQFGKKPLHVLTKSIELQEKIATAQTKHGQAKMQSSKIPLHKITVQDVFQTTQDSLQALRSLKEKLGVKQAISEAPFEDGKNPSNVYENMWRASYLMDGVSGAISPNNVYRNTQVILSDLQVIAAGLGVKKNTGKVEMLIGLTAKDANVEGYKNLHRLYRLQRKLAMSPVRVPEFPTGKITPSHVYDTTNMILGELARIKVKLGIKEYSKSINNESGKKPSDVQREMRVIGKQIDALIETTTKA